jgi:cytoskeletal protein CcmA (bactofilin family)
MFTVNNALQVKGEIRALDDDITVEGSFEGSVFCERGSVVLAPSAIVRGDIYARDITVYGRVSGRLIATDFVDLRTDSKVSGQVLGRIILDDGAWFDGFVAPQHLEAALRVARFERQRATVAKAG